MLDLITKWRTQSKDHRTFSIACPALIFQVYLFAFMTTQGMNWFLGASFILLLLGILLSVGMTISSVIEITEDRAWGMPKEKF